MRTCLPRGCRRQAESQPAQRSEPTKVKDDAVPEVIQAVERGDVTVSVAAEIAELPQAEQRKVVAKGTTAIKTKAKELRTKKRPVVKKNETKVALSTWHGRKRR